MTFLLCGHYDHMAAISEFKMAATSLDMPYMSTYHSSRRLLNAGPTTFAKCVLSRSALIQLQFPLQYLAHLHDIGPRQATSAICNVSISEYNRQFGVSPIDNQ